MCSAVNFIEVTGFYRNFCSFFVDKFSNRCYSDTFRSQNLDDLNEPTDEIFNYVLKELQTQSELVKYSHDQTDQLLNITEGLTR